MQSTVALIVGAVALILFTGLLMSKHLGQMSYVSLLTATGLVCLVLHGFSRLRELDLKNLKVTLDKMERVKEEIFAKEEDLRRVSLLASQLIAFNSAFEGRMHDGESYRLQNEWYYQKIKELLDAVEASPETTADVLKYFHSLRNRDVSAGDQKKLKWDDLMDMIREDIGEDPKLEQEN